MSTYGTWAYGKPCDAIVTNVGRGDAGHVDYYGGHLVAESVPMRFRSLIVSAPKLLEACRAIIAMDNRRGVGSVHDRMRLRDEAIKLAREAVDGIGP